MMAGREELVADVLAQLVEGRGVLLVGVAGVGKSTVLHAVAAAVRAQDAQLLSTAPTEADVRLPFVTLVDLFAGVPAEHFGQLSAGSRRCVEVALRRRDVTASDVDTLAVCLGVLDLLRAVAAERPTVLTIDDLQWVDPASAEVLAFVVRRLDGTRVRIVGVERVAAGEPPTRRELLSPDAVELEVGPLPEDELAPAVIERAGGLVTRPVAQRICQVSGGNPLFALEIADAVRRRGVRPALGEPLPVPVRLDALMRQRLSTLPESVRDMVRLAAAASQPTATLLRQAGCARVLTDLSAAARAGVCELRADGTVVFEHPLLRAAVYAEAPVIVRMGVHARLAETCGDPIERARHLALATSLEDETVAAALATAATLARKRGAPGAARELAGLAAQRTPAADLPAWAERKLAEAEYAYHAGQSGEAQEVAEAVLAADVPPRLRVRARLVIFEACGNGLAQMGEQVAAALADSTGEPDLEPWARIHSDLGDSAYVVYNELGWTFFDTDRYAEAHTMLQRALRTVEETGSVTDIGFALYMLARVELRRGWCVAVKATIARLRQVVADSGPAHQNFALRVMAEAEAIGGSFARAVELAEQSVAETDRIGDAGSVLPFCHVLGLCRLFAGDLDGALSALWRAREHAREPTAGNRVRLLLADLIEALARSGEPGQARSVLAELRASDLSGAAPGAVAAAQRAEATVFLAEGRAADAARLAAASADSYRALSMPIELVRTLLVGAEAERRRRRRAAARSILEEALATAQASVATPWTERVSTELDRLVVRKLSDTN